MDSKSITVVSKMTTLMTMGYLLAAWVMVISMMGAGSGESMPALSGVEGMISPTASPSPATQKEENSLPTEPSVEEQIEQIKELLDWLYEIKDEIDEDTWLDLTGSLKEMLKELTRFAARLKEKGTHFQIL